MPVHAYVDPLKFVRYIVMIAKNEEGENERERERGERRVRLLN